MEPAGLAPPTVHDARERRFGGYLDEYRPGDRYRHWPGKTVTEADDHLFCLLTLAASPLHIDRAYAAAEMPGGRNIVVGTYIYSLLLGMSVPDISGRAIANLGLSDLRALVILQVSGFGQDGPYALHPGFATIAEALSGLSDLMGEAGGAPLLPPIAQTDEVTALAGAFSVMAALRHAERTGEGQWQSSGASMPRLRGF